MKLRALSKGLLVALQLILGLSVLAYLLREIPLSSLREVALGASVPLVLIGMLAMLAAYWLDAIQMTWVLARQEIAAGSGKVLRINLICMFYGLFLPTVIAGGAVRWYHFAKLEHKPTEALAAILFNRVFESLLLVTTCAAALTFELPDQIDLDAGLGLTMAMVLALFICAYLIAFSRHVHELGEAIVLKLPLPSIVQTPIIRLLDALSAFDQMGPAFQLKLFALGLFRQLFASALIMVFVIALKVEVGFVTIIWVRALVALLSLIPITIAGLGVREATFVLTLSQYGVPGEQALALSLLLFLRTVAYGLVGGCVECARVLVAGKTLVEASR